MVILLNGWLLLIGGIESRRFCECSLRSRPVSQLVTLLYTGYSALLLNRSNSGWGEQARIRLFALLVLWSALT